MRVIVSVLLLMVCGFPLLAQEGSGEAAAGENESTAESSNFSQLKDRLSEENLDGRTRLNLLRAAVDRAPTVAEGLELLRAEQSSLEGDLLAKALAAEGRLLALRGDLEEAAGVYSKAAGTASPRTSVEYSIRLAMTGKRPWNGRSPLFRTSCSPLPWPHKSDSGHPRPAGAERLPFVDEDPVLAGRVPVQAHVDEGGPHLVGKGVGEALVELIPSDPFLKLALKELVVAAGG